MAKKLKNTKSYISDTVSINNKNSHVNCEDYEDL